MLGLAPGAEQEVVEAAWLALVKKYHPDHFDGPEAEANARTQRINAAYELIATVEKRRELRARERTPPAPPAAPSRAPPPRRRGPRISVGRYFGRRDPGEKRRLGWGAILLIAGTLALLAYWLLDFGRALGGLPPAAETSARS